MIMGKYQSYPVYKNSGIKWLGEIPEGWKVFRGKFIFREFGERSEKGDETLLSVSEYYGVKPRGEVIDDGEFLSRAESLVGYKKCYKNDLVMNIMLAWKRGLGVTKYDGIVSPAYSVFRFYENASPDYMHYLLRTDLFTGHFKTRSTGVIDSRLRLYPDSFANVPIIVPKIPEQIQIANFLDHETAKIDTLIDKHQQLIKLLKEKRQALISHAVTKGLNPDAPMKDSGVEWLEEVPEHWEVPKLFHVSSRIGDGLHSTPLYQEGTGYFFVNGNNLVDGKIALTASAKEVPFEEFKKHKVELDCSTVLLSINGTIGNLAIYQNESVILGKSAAYINCKILLSREYLMFYLKSDKAIRYYDIEVTGTTIFNLSLNSIRQMKVCMPDIKEQESIVKFCKIVSQKYEKLISKACGAVELLKERRTALISAAVTGKIDVRNWKPTQSENPMEASA